MIQRVSSWFWVLPLALLLAYWERSAEDSKRSTQKPMGDIYLKGSRDWHSLSSLVDASWQYVVSKTSVPPSERSAVVVSINRESTNELARISFGGGVGRQFWEVRIGLDGKVQDYLSGSSGDFHRTLPSRGSEIEGDVSRIRLYFAPKAKTAARFRAAVSCLQI